MCVYLRRLADTGHHLNMNGGATLNFPALCEAFGLHKTDDQPMSCEPFVYRVLCNTTTNKNITSIIRKQANFYIN